MRRGAFGAMTDTVEYVENVPPPALHDGVACLWRLRDASPPAGVQTIYPDGCCELVVHVGEPMRARVGDGAWEAQPRLLFVAQQRQAVRLGAAAPVACIGVRLQPLASALIAGPRLPALRDRIVDLVGLAPDFAATMAAAAARYDASGDPEAIWQAMAARLAGWRPDPRMAQAVARLQATQGGERVEALAAAAGMPMRTFQARFLAVVGLSAKEFARVLRLQAVIRALDAGREGLAGAAVSSGFADQAHATREVRRLTGLTPARLVAALRAERDDEATVRLAAAFVRGGAVAG